MDTDPARRAARIYIDPYEVDLRLHQLGVSRPPLAEAALQGDFQRRLCTQDDFSATAGFVAWARTLRILRERLRDIHDWHNYEFLRIPVTIDQAERVAIAASGGDERTGLDGPDPSTREKGPATQRAVASNETVQGILDLEEEGVEFWYFLTFATDNEVRAELSRPRFIDEYYQICGWDERIILGRIDPDSLDIAAVPPAVPTIDIRVSRKPA